MAQDFEQLLKDFFGDSIDKVTQFQQEKVARLTAKLHEIAREAVKDDMARLTAEIGELRERLKVLEEERIIHAVGEIDSRT